jgi:glutaredoxin
LAAKVQLYGKRDCHLCTVAREILSRVREEIPFDLQEIDIESDRDLYARFKEEIPVVFVDGKRTFTYRVHEGRLRRILSRKG